MAQYPEIPPELWKIRDAAIEHALTGTPLPPDDDIQCLYDWIENVGWDVLMDAWEDEDVAIHFPNLAHYYFSDSEFFAREILEDGEELNDARRVEYARNLIESVITGEVGDDIMGVHTYRIELDGGKCAVVGCTVESDRKGRPFVEWLGVFPTKDAFWSCLRKAGVLMLREVKALDDAVILAAWEGK